MQGRDWMSKNKRK